jgi:hypothetical protein
VIGTEWAERYVAPDHPMLLVLCAEHSEARRRWALLSACIEVWVQAWAVAPAFHSICVLTFL